MLSMSMEPYYFRVGSADRETIERLATEEDRSGAWIIRAAIRAYAASRQGPQSPLMNAAHWFMGLSDEVREQVVRIGEALAAREEDEKRGAKPLEKTGIAPRIPRDEGKPRTTRRRGASPRSR